MNKEKDTKEKADKGKKNDKKTCGKEKEASKSKSKDKKTAKNKEKKETGIPWLSGTASSIPSVHDAERIVLGETECRRCRRGQLPAHVRRPESLSVPPELFDDRQRSRHVKRNRGKVRQRT